MSMHDLSGALSKTTSSLPPAAFASSGRSSPASRLDRFYTTLLGWTLVAMQALQADCGILTALELLYAKGVSDHV